MLRVFHQHQYFTFPPVEMADDDGLLAIGGNLSREMLLQAYRLGIFPWYDAAPIMWWCPHPRMVLFPEDLHISRSMQKLIRRDVFSFTMNKAFEQVIHLCKTISRADQLGTWITPELEEAFRELHADGYAQSGEAWQDGKLVGGIYGLRLGNIFFAESMFSLETNASKFALINMVQQLQQDGVVLIDCQVYSSHLQTMGARPIPRSEFSRILADSIPAE